MSIYVIYGLLATLFTWSVTAVGAATVIFFKNPKESTLDILLGFSAGVMISASFWSLLNPAMELSHKSTALPPFIILTSGFLLGSFTLIFIDMLIKYLNVFPNSKYKDIALLFISITLHNIPEGLAVGVAFGSVGLGIGNSLFGAVSIAVGIGIQNFPEGAAVSLPFRRAGFSRRKSFMLGQASAFVEPIFGFIGALLVIKVNAILPYALSFAAGAMITVTAHEIIPECQKSNTNGKYSATVGVILGFSIMMLLDIMLG